MKKFSTFVIIAIMCAGAFAQMSKEEINSFCSYPIFTATETIKFGSKLDVKGKLKAEATLKLSGANREKMLYLMDYVDHVTLGTNWAEYVDSEDFEITERDIKLIEKSTNKILDAAYKYSDRWDEEIDEYRASLKKNSEMEKMYEDLVGKAIEAQNEIIKTQVESQKEMAQIMKEKNNSSKNSFNSANSSISGKKLGITDEDVKNFAKNYNKISKETESIGDNPGNISAVTKLLNKYGISGDNALAKVQAITVGGGYLVAEKKLAENTTSSDLQILNAMGIDPLAMYRTGYENLHNEDSAAIKRNIKVLKPLFDED